MRGSCRPNTNATSRGAAAALTDSTWGFAWLFDGDVLRSRGTTMDPKAYEDLPPEAHVQALDSAWPIAIATRAGRSFAVDDWPKYLREHGETEHERSDEYLQHYEATGARAAMAAPLGTAPCIGAITVLRADPRPFDESEIAILEAFAAEAVTAIETARTQQVLADSLARETAVAEVLQAISRSVDDTAPVFERILDSCERQFATDQIALVLVDEHQVVHARAVRGAKMRELTSVLPLPLDQTATGWTIRERRALHAPGIASFPDPLDSMRRALATFGDASLLYAPMLQGEQGIGSIALVRSPPQPFSDAEIALLTAFTDQAVIAVQNARMFAALQTPRDPRSSPRTPPRTAHTG